MLFELIVLLLPIDDAEDAGIGIALNVASVDCNTGILWSTINVEFFTSNSRSSPFVALWLRLTLPKLDVVLLLTYPLDSVLKFKLVCDSSILYIVILFVRLDNVDNGIVVVVVLLPLLFDKSIDTDVACGLKFTVGFGRDITRSDGDGDDETVSICLTSSKMRKKRRWEKCENINKNKVSIDISASAICKMHLHN